LEKARDRQEIREILIREGRKNREAGQFLTTIAFNAKTRKGNGGTGSIVGENTEKKPPDVGGAPVNAALQGTGKRKGTRRNNLQEKTSKPNRAARPDVKGDVEDISAGRRGQRKNGTSPTVNNDQASERGEGVGWKEKKCVKGKAGTEDRENNKSKKNPPVPSPNPASAPSSLFLD